jgi:uncharacterized protein (UPF0276 family)
VDQEPSICRETIAARRPDQLASSATGPGVARVGVGLRGPHMAYVADHHPPIGWFEVHAENYFADAPALARLVAIRRDYPLSLHGVGLSMGSATGLDREHLRRLRELARAIDPFLVSEHLAWSIADGVYLNDLLPLPYTEEALAIVEANVGVAQEALGRTVLLENPSTYLRFRHSTIPEAEFLAELARRTGCGILCDVNNVFVSCANLGEDARDYIAALPPERVAEIHLAGHSRHDGAPEPLLIDDHGSSTAKVVMELYSHACRRFGAQPTLVEWDTGIPEFSVLQAEAARVASASAARCPPSTFPC